MPPPQSTTSSATTGGLAARSRAVAQARARRSGRRLNPDGTRPQWSGEIVASSRSAVHLRRATVGMPTFSLTIRLLAWWDTHLHWPVPSLRCSFATR